MSCAEGGEVDCAEVLDQVYEYLNGELGDESIALVKGHLDDCSPCLQEFGLEDAVRKLVATSCACEAAPDRLRRQIRTRITEIRVSVSGPGLGANLTVTSTSDVEPFA